MRLQKGIARAATHSTHSVQQSPQILVACCLAQYLAVLSPQVAMTMRCLIFFYHHFTFSVTHARNLAGSL